MTNDREHINCKPQLGKNPSSPGSSINVRQTAAWAVAAFSHSEPHKSNEARTAPLTLTQEMREEKGEGQAGSGWDEGKSRKRKNAFLFTIFDLLFLLLTGVDEETRLHCFC